MPRDVALRPSVVVACALAILSCAAGAHAQAVDPGFNPGADQTIWAMAVQGDGKIIVGGGFTHLGGGTGTTLRNHIGRLNVDGTVDLSFDPGANSIVQAIAVQPDGKILIGGNFTSVGGGTGLTTQRNHIARLNPDGTVDPVLNPGANGNVYALIVQPDGKILVGGEFSTMGGGSPGTPRNRLARLNPDGSPDSFNPGVSKPSASAIVYTMALQPDGKVVVGGYFNGLGGGDGLQAVRNYIGRINADGSLDTGFNPGAASISGVNALAIQADGKILVGGSFVALGAGGATVAGGGTSRSNIGRLNADGSVDLGFNPGVEAQVLTLGVQVDGKILAGGYFKWMGDAGGPSKSTRNYIGRLFANGVVDGTFDPGANNIVNALAIQGDGAVLAAGVFGLVGGGSVTPPGGTSVRNRIARFQPTNAASQTLTLSTDGTVETWMRSGSGPEVSWVTFEFSFDGTGPNPFYSLLGLGTRIAGGWQLNSVNIPPTRKEWIRARGYHSSGFQNGSGSIVEQILVLEPVPVAVTGIANAITPTTATLNGTANPNGFATNARFDYGLTASYGSSTPVQSMGSGTANAAIGGGAIGGLTCSTIYHFRATATNVNGTMTGFDSTFTTATCPPTPIVTTGVATVIGLAGATLNGTANPNGAATTASFQYGPTAAYGSTTPGQAIGAGSSTLAIGGGTVAGLTCNSLYHFRAVATNTNGTTNGLDSTFTTPPCTRGAVNGFVYAVNQVIGARNLIYAYGVTPITGALVQIPGFPVPTGTGSFGTLSETLAYDAVNARLYSINEGDNSISAYSVDRATGALTPMPFSPIVLGGSSGSWHTVKVHPSGSPVIAGSTFALESFVVTPTTATPATGSPFAFSTNSLSAVFSRDGLYYYTGGSSGPSFGGYSVNAGTGVLTALAGSPFTGSYTSAGLATDSSGRLFSTGSIEDKVRAFTTSSGVPVDVSGSPFPAGGLSEALNAVLHPSGFYIAAARGNNKIGVYQISGSGSATTMTAVAGSPFASGGTFTSAVALTGNGGLLIAAHGSSRNLSVLGVNAGTGALTPFFVQPANTLGNSGNVTGLVFAASGAPFGDFDGGGKSDLVMHNNTTGQTVAWLMNGLTVANSGFLPTIADTNWKVRGRGDLDGDGKSDVILANTSTGQNVGWLMNGLTVTNSAFLPLADPNWEMKGFGDLDGDGKADILFRNRVNGQNVGWLMNGLTITSAAFLPAVADTNWEIVGVGDLSGDGKADVFWRHKTNGQNVGWLMNGLTLTSSAFLPAVADTNWEVKGVGDFDGDGKADVILRQKNTGQNVAWLMNGLTVTNAGFLPVADPNWEIKGLGDFDGDGKSDVVLRNKVNGQNVGWLMNGLTVSGAAFLPQVVDLNWDFVGQGQ